MEPIRQSLTGRGLRSHLRSRKTESGREVRPLHGFDGYSTNLPLALAREDALIVHHWEGKPLEREHGGPARVVVSKVYAWKGAKWVKDIIFLPQDNPGFWEVRGYSDAADPWTDDRFS